MWQLDRICFTLLEKFTFLQVFVIEWVDMSMPTSEIKVRKTSAFQTKKYHLSTQWSETFTISGYYTTTGINTTYDEFCEQILSNDFPWKF